jgi:hypothetical protein
VPEKGAGDTTQERTGEVRVQDIRSAAEEGQAVRATRKPGAEEVASGLEAETGNTLESSSAESEAEGVGGNGIARKGEVVAAVVGGNLIDMGDIRHGSDKTVVGAHALSGSLPEEGGDEKADCTRVGRGGHAGMEEEGRVGVGLGRHSGSEHENPEAKKEDHGETDMRIYAENLHQGRNLRAGNAWNVCLSMSNLNGGVCGIDEPRHADLVQRLGGVMIAVVASAVVAAADLWSLGHMNMAPASGVTGGVAAGAGTSTGGAEVVGGNGEIGGRRTGSRPRLSWTDSSHVGGVGRG